jgi:large subunit ribosomal protein L13
VNTLSYRTTSVKAEDVQRKWYVVDAEDKTVGRLCTTIASILRGKNKPSYTPHTDTGDYVIVINAEKVRFTGNKWAQKEYKNYSLHPGGLRVMNAEMMRDKFPERIVERAIKGMMPKNRLGRAQQKKLFVYAGAHHPHAAQKPESLQGV